MASYELATLTSRQLFRKYLRKKAWHWFDWQQNYFVKPNDAISRLPLAGEVHDEDVVEALKHLAHALPERFIDLGANIGLVSMQLAGLVRRIDCVEPNPLVCGVLRINLSLNCSDFTIHEIGLGAADADATLYIPRGNLGGAFISEDNEYSHAQLASKDGYAHYDPSNYLTQPVKIRECAQALRDIVLDVPDSLLIKIDVEGLDALIMRTILEEYLPWIERRRLAMVFESHDHRSAQELAEAVAAHGYGVFGLRIVRSPAMRQPVVRRLIKLFRGERRRLEFVPLAALAGDRSVTNFACCPAAMVDR
ncbi:MAG TPA: FkbM family methyltransferase [Albitalea sp.]|uniref:FkbM family methyltransferase n=1 Tax=Piscinibacter sp. TaxID=1903157 RepID=UPI002ED5FD3F